MFSEEKISRQRFNFFLQDLNYLDGSPGKCATFSTIEYIYNESKKLSIQLSFQNEPAKCICLLVLTFRVCILQVYANVQIKLTFHVLTKNHCTDKSYLIFIMPTNTFVKLRCFSRKPSILV